MTGFARGTCNPKRRGHRRDGWANRGGSWKWDAVAEKYVKPVPRFVEQQLWSGESTRIAGNQRNLVASAAGHIERGVWGPGRWGVIGAAGRDRRTRIGPDWGARRATRAGSALLTPQLFVTSFCALRQKNEFLSPDNKTNLFRNFPPRQLTFGGSPQSETGTWCGVAPHPCTCFILRVSTF